MKKLVLDMDSSVSETYGRQEGTAYYGHFGCTCYHPLFCFNQFGDVESALLREGNVHSANDWRTVLEPIVARYRERDIPHYFRRDAAFANPEIYGYLEAEHFQYVIRLPANDVLHREIEHLLTRPVGRPPRSPIVLYQEFQYQAAAWNHKRRVNAKVEWHHRELFPRVDNQVRLQLFAHAHNLGNFFRQAALLKSVRHWTMTSLREKVIKIGAKVVCHARYVIFQMAEVAVSQELFAAILGKIRRLRLLVEASG